jgi:hypothetical protein
VTQQAWFFQTSPENRSTLPTPASSAAALKGSATMNPAIARAASADTISAGGSTIRLTSLGAIALSRGRTTGTSFASRSSRCSSRLWMLYQKGTATVLPPRSAIVVTEGATVRADPLTWFQAVIRAGKRVP